MIFKPSVFDDDDDNDGDDEFIDVKWLDQYVSIYWPFSTDWFVLNEMHSIIMFSIMRTSDFRDCSFDLVQLLKSNSSLPRSSESQKE